MMCNSPPRVLVVTLGATALQAYDPTTGGMALRVQPAQLLAAAVDALESDGQVETVLHQVPQRSGAELTMATLCAVRDVVLAHLDMCPSAVLLCGTDTLEEAAFVLHLMLGCELARRRAVLCVTGAMLPADQLGGDGPKNLRDALRVATNPGVLAAAPGQVLVVMNDAIHLAQYVRKADSQLAGAFRSHPGPLGELRGGAPLLYYAPPPPLPQQQQEGQQHSNLPVDAPPQATQAAHPPWLPRPEFGRLPAAALTKRVAVWTLTVDGLAPPDALLAELDGLVLAGSGSGSVPAAVVERLAGSGDPSGTDDGCSATPPWTARLPIVIASRCNFGANHDNYFYRGSRAKYERRGFVLGCGYEQLNPLQARGLLALRLAAFGRP